MNEIKINVIGKAGSGKSTIASIITQALWNHGIDAEVYHQDGESEADVRQHLYRKVECIAVKGTKVIITEHQTSRLGQGAL